MYLLTCKAHELCVASIRMPRHVDCEPATSVQGFPVSFGVDGEQYVAVTTGLGGGSPRNVPNLLAPDVRYPRTGNALYVFKLRDQ